MDAASIEFVLFGLTAALVSNLSGSAIWRSSVLFAASLAFLGLLARDPVSLLPLAGFLLLGYLQLFLIQRGWSRHTIWSLVVVVLAYVWLKKYSFLPHSTFIHESYFTIGLSYIFFRVLHLLIETADGNEKPQVGPIGYLLYTLNFTTLVSGPIQPYSEFARDQFASKPVALDARIVGFQLERIVRGFFKVNVLAMLLHETLQDALTQISEPVAISLKFFAAFQIAVTYPFFLYANFSGYIDIVVAVARLMRVRLPENFDRPFSASSFIEFWSRWHITLSNWLKTYVYNPLLMTLMRRITSPRLEPLLGVFSFFVTFFLIGVWHGRTSEFIVFGILQGGGVALNKLWQVALTRAVGRKTYKRVGSGFAYVALGRGLTFSWFAFTLIWFWGDWKQIDNLFSALRPVQWVGVWCAIWLCSSAVLETWERARGVLLSIKTSAGNPVLTSRYARVVYASVLCVAAVVFTAVLEQPAPDIVYKAF